MNGQKYYGKSVINTDNCHLSLWPIKQCHLVGWTNGSPMVWQKHMNKRNALHHKHCRVDLVHSKKFITMTLKSHHCVSELALSKQSIVRHFTVVKVSRGLCQCVSWCAKICGVHTTKNRPFELVCKMFASPFFPTCHWCESFLSRLGAYGFCVCMQ